MCLCKSCMFKLLLLFFNLPLQLKLVYLIAFFVIMLINLPNGWSIDITNSSMFLFVVSEATVCIWLYYDALMCRHIICNTSDLASECPNPHDSRYYPERILLYDQHPGGIGVSVQVSDMKLENPIMNCDIFHLC